MVVTHPAPSAPRPTTMATPEVVAALLADNVRLATELSEARHAATHDALTGLPNRHALDEAEGLIRQGLRRGDAVVVVMLDVVGFKGVNDHHGHPVGDAVLVEYGRRLTDIAADCGGMALRLGGDEFALVLTVTDDLIAHLQAIHHRLAKPMTVNGQQLVVKPRIGATIAIDVPLLLLLGEADSALYRVRRTGDAFAVYAPGTDVPPFDPDVHRRPVTRLRDIRTSTCEYMESAA